jgi:hypothetical protein
MSKIHWTNPVNADFSTAADWSGGVVPGASDAAILDAAGSPFTVIASVSETVSSIQLVAAATLDITGGTFTAVAGTGRGANAGNIILGYGCSLAIGGTLDNTGVITLQNGFVGTAGVALTSSTILSGGGAVTMTLGGRINAAADAGLVAFTNVDNTISGVGAIGDGTSKTDSINIVNGTGGTIEADGGNGEYLQLGTYNVRTTISNHGLLEATNFSVMDIVNADVIGTGGKFLAQGMQTSIVEFTNCSVANQLLVTGADGAIYLEDGSSIEIKGNVQNSGAIDVIDSKLTFDSSVALSGGGVIGLVEGGVVSGIKSSIVLTNVDNVIRGAGTGGESLGNGEMTLVNNADGTIVAIGGKMSLNTGRNTIINAGLIEINYLERGHGGSMVIKSNIENNGIIFARADNCNTLTVIKLVTGSGSVTIDGGTIDFESSFNQDVNYMGTNGALILSDSQIYTANIAGFTQSGGTSLDLRDISFVSAGEATFSGTQTGGVLTVTDGTHTASINLVGDYLGTTFVASSDGKNGTDVVAMGGQTPSTAHFVEAMASTGHSVSAGLIDARGINDGRQMMLAAPRLALA